MHYLIMYFTVCISVRAHGGLNVVCSFIMFHGLFQTLTELCYLNIFNRMNVFGKPLSLYMFLSVVVVITLRSVTTSPGDEAHYVLNY